MNKSKVSELFESKYGERIMKVPRTIAKPGKASTSILVEGLIKELSDDCHLFNTRTKINGDTNLNNNVNKANGQRRWGEVEVK